MGSLDGKRILITGACGTVGKELVAQLLHGGGHDPAELVCVDNNESGLFFLDQEYLSDNRVRCFLGDIRDGEKMGRLMRGVNVVFHLAALKHVILSERSPFEAVQSNIHGVQNIITTAEDAGVEKVIFTSSDKAVNPTNVMGTTKLMGERLMTAANSTSRSSATIYSSTRFGNVLGSNGSVVPIFKRQIEKGGPVTITDKDMTRFVMSIEEAAKLVLDSADVAHGGEVFITKMPVVRIEDLAAVMIEELAERHGHKPEDIEMTVIGSKPGEKLYEELMTDEETRRSVELENYFSVLPAFRGIYEDKSYEYEGTVSTDVTNPYVSANEEPLSREEIRKFLIDNRLLETKEETHPDKRYFPGDKA